MFTNSLTRIKPAKAIRHAVISHTFQSALCSLVSWTIALSISAVIGSFFCVGLARVLYRPSKAVFTNGLSIGGMIPAIT